MPNSSSKASAHAPYLRPVGKSVGHVASSFTQPTLVMQILMQRLILVLQQHYIDGEFWTYLGPVDGDLPAQSCDQN